MGPSTSLHFFYSLFSLHGLFVYSTVRPFHHVWHTYTQYWYNRGTDRLYIRIHWNFVVVPAAKHTASLMFIDWHCVSLLQLFNFCLCVSVWVYFDELSTLLPLFVSHCRDILYSHFSMKAMQSMHHDSLVDAKLFSPPLHSLLHSMSFQLVQLHIALSLPRCLIQSFTTYYNTFDISHVLQMLCGWFDSSPYEQQARVYSLQQLSLPMCSMNFLSFVLSMLFYGKKVKDVTLQNICLDRCHPSVNSQCIVTGFSHTANRTRFELAPSHSSSLFQSRSV